MKIIFVCNILCYVYKNMGSYINKIYTTQEIILDDYEKNNREEFYSLPILCVDIWISLSTLTKKKKRYKVKT